MSLNNSLNFLIVDDVELNCVFYSAMLDHLNLCKKQHFDIIFMDCLMPERSGYEATSILREYENENQQKPTVIIALTAQISSEARIKAITVGMDDFVQKPLTTEALSEVVDVWGGICRARKDMEPDIQHAPFKGHDGLSEDCVLFDGDMALSLKGLLKDKYEQMVGHFKTDIQNYVGAAYEGAETGDLKKIHMAMHTIKSTSHQIGLLRVAHLAAKLEYLCDCEYRQAETAPCGVTLRKQLDHLQQAYILSEELLDKI